MKNPAKVLLSLFMLLPLLGCSELDEVTDPSGVTVSGRVMQDGVPLEGSNVGIGSDGISTSTNSDGEFSLQLESTGSFEFRFKKVYEKGGVVERTRSVTVEGDTVLDDVEMPSLIGALADDDPFTRTIQLTWEPYQEESFLEYRLHRYFWYDGTDLWIYQSDNQMDTTFVDGLIDREFLELTAGKTHAYQLEIVTTDTTVKLISDTIYVPLPTWDDPDNFYTNYSLSEVNRFNAPDTEFLSTEEHKFLTDMVSDGTNLWVAYAHGWYSAPRVWKYEYLLYKLDPSTGEILSSSILDSLGRDELRMVWWNDCLYLRHHEVISSTSSIDRFFALDDSGHFEPSKNVALELGKGVEDVCTHGDSLILADAWEKIAYYDPATETCGEWVDLPFNYGGGFFYVMSIENEIWAISVAWEPSMMVLNRNFHPIAAVPRIIGEGAYHAGLCFHEGNIYMHENDEIIAYEIHRE